MATGWPMKTTYANGDVYSASDVNDTNGTINLLGSSVAYAAGKNRIINGDFFVNQRSFSSSTALGYTFDRWNAVMSGGTVTWSAQTFTPGAAPVAGYEGATFIQVITSGQTGSNYALLEQKIENVRTLAGQTATLSFWAKAASGTPKMRPYYYQDFGTGGSPSASVAFQGTDITISTTWTRYSQTVSIPSISGKTIGTTANSSHLRVQLEVSDGNTLGIQNGTFQIWGVQLEQGSTATAFQTATGTIQGELAACQRYYWRATSPTNYTGFANGQCYSTTAAAINVVNPVPMRVGPTSVEFSTLGVYNSTGSPVAITGLALNYAAPLTNNLAATGASGLTAGNATILSAQNSTSAYLGFSAEL
jgi:hypothetical protein